MKDFFKVLAAGLAILIAIVGIAWVLQGNQFFLYRYFAPKTEGVRREVFEQSKAYKQGMIQELQNMQFEYVKADDAHKKSLAAIILHRAADFDDGELPADLRSFIDGLRSDRIR